MNILVTGGAGFIGSNLVEALLEHEAVEKVRVLDNLSTGSLKNLEPFLNNPQFEFLKEDIRDTKSCKKACENMDAITHQAALGSVPRSINDPATTNNVNITGALNIFNAAREQGIKRVVYASSSSVYGDDPGLPKVENKTGRPLSPYAVTKQVNELYAHVFANIYGMEFIGLRYFNIFGPRQSPDGPYAAVIPLFAQAILEKKPPVMNGDGTNSRDFTYVANAVQANIKALLTDNPNAVNQVYNIACGERTDLLELYEYMRDGFSDTKPPVFGLPRAGDVPHSLANIDKAKELLAFDPQVSVREGLKKTMQFYLNP